MIMDYIGIAFIVVAVAVGVGMRFMKKPLPNDNPIEQLAEKVIKDKTGIEIDFSPEQENKKE